MNEVWRPLGLPGRSLDALGPGSPLAHRVAHAAVARGLRGRDLYWRWAERLAGPPREGQLVLSGGPRIAVDCVDVGERRIYKGGYQIAERSLVAAVVGTGGSVLDVGANIGLITAASAALVGEHGRVHAFEPNPPIVERLRATVGALPQVTVHQVALSDKPGTASLQRELFHHAATAVRIGEPGELTVAVSTVDEIVKREGIGSVDLLKIDVEGEEERVLRGAVGLVRSRRVAHLLVEVHLVQGSGTWLDAWLDGVADDYRVFRVGYEPGLLGFRRVPRLTEDAWPSARVSEYNLLVSRRDRVVEVP